MLVQFDCCRCVLKQAVELSEKYVDTEARHWEMFDDIVRHLLDHRHHASPPELAEQAFATVVKFSGVRDCYAREKAESTRLAWELWKTLDLEKLSFDQRLLLAIGGNAIDFGVHPDFDLSTAQPLVLAALDQPYDQVAAQELAHRMASARKIFYILDNCGEAVFDRLLINLYPEKITLGVRGGAILNDVTRAELAESGLGEFPVCDTGRAAPGVPYPNISPDFRREMESADLVIAKGQGNFESLTHTGFVAAPIYYLFKAKCPVVANLLDKNINDIAIIGKNLE